MKRAVEGVVHDPVPGALRDGRTLEEVQEMNLAGEWETEQALGLIGSEALVTFICRSLLPYRK